MKLAVPFARDGVNEVLKGGTAAKKQHMPHNVGSNYKYSSAAGNEKVHKIGHVSRMVGLSQKRIRDYEKEGLIKPARNPNTNDRLFSEFDLKQIKKIKYLIHERGFTVSALKHLLRAAPGWEVFQCQEKEHCEVSEYPDKRCWEVRREVNKVHYRKVCAVCPIYLARKKEKIQLLEKPDETA